MKNISVFSAALLLLCAGCGGRDGATDTGADTTKTPEPARFTLSYELSGGSGDFPPVAVDSGAAAAAPGGEPGRAAYCFAGWFADSSATSPFNFGAPVTKNLTAYAGWRKQHTVTLLSVGEEPQVQYVCDGDSMLLAEPAKDSVSFVGWYADSAFTVKFEGAKNLRRDTALYARWIRALRIDVTEYSATCNGMMNPFTFFAAYEDEPGTYSNKVSGSIHPTYYPDDNGNDYSVNGNNYIGGEAIAACRSKGDGWYLPSSCEFSNMAFLKKPPFQPFPNGATYWTSTKIGSDAKSYSSSEVDNAWIIGTVSSTNRYKVRCAWRPE